MSAPSSKHVHFIDVWTIGRNAVKRQKSKCSRKEIERRMKFSEWEMEEVKSHRTHRAAMQNLLNNFHYTVLDDHFHFLNTHTRSPSAK